MNNRNLITGSLAAGLLILFSGVHGNALVQGAGGQARTDSRAGQSGGAQDVRQHGYEHAYRDGADRGRQDRDAGMRYNLNNADYEYGAREYQGNFGDRAQYMAGYREGYKAGYDDGYYDRPGQWGRLYGGQASGRSGDARGGQRGDQRGNTSDVRSGGLEDRSFDTGYRSGITSGQQDQRGNVRSNYRGTPEYQNAAGYRPSDGDRNTYTLHFRDGFERGYADGYGRTQHSSDGGGYYPARDGNGAVDTRDGQGPSTRTITVAGNQLWTPTGIRVTQGDPFQFQTTGEVRFSANPNDKAASYGAVIAKYLPGSQLPKALAGALIGRIDNGLPWGIGGQTTILMPGSGMLYLGINDDNVTGNAGEFRVILSW